MGQEPFFSVIIPCYKAEEYFEGTTNSVLKQSFHDVELVLVNDNSPGNISEMCNQLAAKDPRVKVFHRKTNGGISAATNDGIKLVQGRYVTFLDNDDYMEEDVFQKIYEKIEKEGIPPDIVQCFYYIEKGELKNAKVLKSIPEFTLMEGSHADKVLRLHVEGRLTNSNASKFVRTALIRENDIKFNSRYDSYQDFDFALRVYLAAQTIIYPEVFTYSHVYRGGSVSHSMSTESWQNRLNYCTDWIDYSETLPLSDEVRQAFQNFLMGKIRMIWDSVAYGARCRPEVNKQSVYETVKKPRKYLKRWQPKSHSEIIDKCVYMVMGPRHWPLIKAALRKRFDKKVRTTQ